MAHRTPRHVGSRDSLARSALLAAWLALLSSANVAGAEAPVRFNRDIRPILAANCFTCHGMDAEKRAADLRLDDRAWAVERSEAIVPGKPLDSPLWERIVSSDPEERMPPPAAKKAPLTPVEMALIRRWIEAGAPYEPHWAYVKPKRPPLPNAADAGWGRNPIDRFVAAGYAEQGLKPVADAEARTLVRRVWLDLLGLPPRPADVDAYLADPSPEAYRRLVDRLLATPQHAERMTSYWLDVARYADTCGYHSDNERNVWMYRDYVISAFRQNMPFDRFTAEQLAGDLLPEATDEQRVASGYNRLLQTTEEGGAQAKEYTAKFAADRVRNTATAWLGQTFGCAQCHDHKYDPLTIRDFYSFAAFFADVGEVAIKRQIETPFPSPDQAAALARLKAEMAPFEKQLDAASEELDAAQAAWEAELAKDTGRKKGLPKDVAAALRVPRENRSGPQKKVAAAYFRAQAAQTAAIRAQLDPLQRRLEELEKQIPRTLMTEAVEPRVTRILPRGNWMDDSGPIVGPAIPAAFGALNVPGRATRLDLARWLTSPDNPLVARVFVNRLWKILFGQGIVSTLEDYGTQGALATHPDLLDWLAVEFVESGWDVRHMIRLMVTSRTYRLSSAATPELTRRDPANHWLARQGRFRIDAEMIRDSALSASGLLSPKVGGPSVKPYQPAGYWEFLNFPKREWVADRGENQYRRGLYTFWQRTLLHPSMMAFDACSREESCPDRPRSNTPLQALALLNDPTYVEAARVLAVRIVREGGETDAERLAFAFRQIVQRSPSAAEAQRLTRLYEHHKSQFAADAAAANALVHVGDTPPPTDVPAAPLAAWTSVARVLLNLHETITRE